MALGFAGFKNLKKKAVRAPLNPVDKCTIVNIFPKDIHERKLTLTPSEYYIPAGSYDKPGILVITSASWWRDVGEDEPLLEIVQGSPIIADSLVKDYCNGLLGCNMSDSMPGIFWLPGELTAEEVKLKHKVQLDKARANQLRYYQTLVRMADSLWARTNGNPLAIHNDAKLAAHELQLTREWMQTFVATEFVKCIACGSMRNPLFPICPTCKAVVDQEAAKKLNLKFAE